MVGFDASLSQQPEGAIDGLRLFYSGFPIIGTVVAIWVMSKYEISEEKANEVRAQLDAKRVAQ